MELFDHLPSAIDSFAQSAAVLAQHAQFQHAGPQTNVSMIGMQVLITVWIFVLGACFGSFLNVVIYRLPAGMSLGHPKSRCPKCETPLAARDNIPVLGWIALRGKCRYCDLPIPVRYPLIESVCGVLFLALMFGELLTGAENLPLRHPDHFAIRSGFWLVWFMKWDLSGVYLFHCCMLLIVLATVMIGYDGHAPVKKLTWFAIVVSLVTGVVCPDVRPVAALPYVDLVGISNPALNSGNTLLESVLPRAFGLIDGVLGLVAGIFFGWLVRWQMTSLVSENRVQTQQAPYLAIAAAFIPIGGFLGWQGAGMLAVFVLPMMAVVRLLSLLLKPEIVRMVAPGFFVMSGVFLLTWNTLHKSWWMIGIFGWSPSSAGPATDWLLTVVALLCLATAVRLAFSRAPVESRAADESSKTSDDDGN